MMKSNQLWLVRTDTFQNVPREVLEDSADEFLTSEVVDKIYKINFQNDPNTLIYELRNEESKSCGVLWLQIEPLIDALNCRFIGVLSEYRDKTVAPKLDMFMTNIALEMGFKKILGTSSKDMTYWNRFGWKETNTKIIVKEV